MRHPSRCATLIVTITSTLLYGIAAFCGYFALDEVKDHGNVNKFLGYGIYFLVPSFVIIASFEGWVWFQNRENTDDGGEKWLRQITAYLSLLTMCAFFSAFFCFVYVLIFGSKDMSDNKKTTLLIMGSCSCIVQAILSALHYFLRVV
ncbi:unnamed protein product [Cuscuta epithymum]|uniref:Transmembrane protein n=1 Tax=Cuscuta epithymum TaxID=186058 RepID=A0AAV0DVF9_9ASTE|nr:unnamed protein product [Cuscuta epithymum]